MPLEAPRAIIDRLDKQTSAGLAERLVRTAGIYSNGPGCAAANGFVGTLTAAHRELLTDMLRDGRMGAIHDAVAILT